MSEHELEEVTSALNELKVKAPAFLLADPAKLKRLNPSLREVIEFAKIPYDKDVLRFSLDKKKFNLSVHLTADGEVEFVYQHALPQSSVLVDESCIELSLQSIYFKRSLWSYKLDLVQQLILEDLLELKHACAAYTVQFREFQNDTCLTTKFVVETDLHITEEEFLVINGIKLDDALVIERRPNSMKEESLS